VICLVYWLEPVDGSLTMSEKGSRPGAMPERSAISSKTNPHEVTVTMSIAHVMTMRTCLSADTTYFCTSNLPKYFSVELPWSRGV
jgi:hypothetical protein